MEKETVTLGIDLGTTNTVVSFWNPLTKQLESLDPIRSCAQFLDGKEKACVDPQMKGVALCPKRLIGKEFTSPEQYSPIIFGLPVCNVKVESGNGQSCDRYIPGYVVSENPEKKVTATYVDTLILKHVKNEVQKILGDHYTVDRAIITIPVAFSWEQRMETYRAAVEAGFKNVSLQQEPVMAAYFYCTERNLTNKQILVYDFGGGTFDLCLIRFADNCFSVLKFDGDDYLGGEDITCTIASQIEDQLDRMYRNWRKSLSPKQIANVERAIRRKSEEIKCNLRTLDQMEVEAREFFIHWDKTFVLDLRDTKIIQVVEHSLTITNSLLNGESVDAVLMVGGTSDFAIVRTKLQEQFQEKLVTDLNPKSCVAMGAAKFGHENPVFETKIGGMVVKKVLGRSIGWKGSNMANHYIAKEGDTLPKEGEMKFRLTKDDDHITTKLIEGEDTMIKELQIKLDKVYPMNTQFLLKLSVNEDLLIYYEVVILNKNRDTLQMGMVKLE